MLLGVGVKFWEGGEGLHVKVVKGKVYEGVDLLFHAIDGINKNKKLTH
jgi:hypothetical protein